MCRFAYQKLRGWRPILSAHSAQAFFLAAGTLLLALGIPILVASLNVKEYSVRYDDAGPLEGLTKDQQQEAIWAAQDQGLTYPVNITVSDTMTPPIYVVIELDPFYQNYRRYVRSYDPDQMKDGSSVPGVDACNPYRFVNNQENETLPQSGAILPCGQISNSFFNDTFALSTAAGDELTIDDSDIAWSADREHLYGEVMPVNYNIYPTYRGGNTTTVPLNQNQHWMVWQRVAGQVPAQKLYGRIDQEIEAGTVVQINVQNRYNTYAFGGKKRLILTTNSWVGGKNLVLPILYLVAGGLCYMIALFFFVGYDMGKIWKRKPGAVDDFSWVRNHGGKGFDGESPITSARLATPPPAQFERGLNA